jgi:hypothetical protein
VLLGLALAELAIERSRAPQVSPALRPLTLYATQAEQAAGLACAVAEGGGDVQRALVALARVVVALHGGDVGEAAEAVGLACAVAEGGGDL